jgi:hypothetical protein
LPEYVNNNATGVLLSVKPRLTSFVDISSVIVHYLIYSVIYCKIVLYHLHIFNSLDKYLDAGMLSRSFNKIMLSPNTLLIRRETTLRNLLE